MTIPLQPAVQAGFARALAAVTDLGARVLDVSVPLLARATAINDAIVPPETMAQHANWQTGWFRGRDIRYGEDVAQLLAAGATVRGTATISGATGPDRTRAPTRQRLHQLGRRAADTDTADDGDPVGRADDRSGRNDSFSLRLQPGRRAGADTSIRRR